MESISLNRRNQLISAKISWAQGIPKYVAFFGGQLAGGCPDKTNIWGADWITRNFRGV